MAPISKRPVTDAVPEQFLYNRKGPWPQPSPSYPRLCADEVLHIPEMESLLFNETVGRRYLETQMQFRPIAAMMAAYQHDNWTGIPDDVFQDYMLNTVFMRFSLAVDNFDIVLFKQAQITGDAPNLDDGRWTKYDFTSMCLVEPIAGTYAAATKLFLKARDDGTRSVVYIQIWTDYHASAGSSLCVSKHDGNAWELAKLFAMQGASYNTLFVAHPAIHFPMDSINAITKTSIPVGHPLFQLFAPHSAYALALNNAVLESAHSVVANDAQGTRFDPLTADGRNVRLLFGAGYNGLDSDTYGNAYLRYDYMDRRMDDGGSYVDWLNGYYDKAFLPFCEQVAKFIMADDSLKEYAENWARHCSIHVRGFPDRDRIFKKERLEGVVDGQRRYVEDSNQPPNLAKVMAIYIWNNSIVHGGDHQSFWRDVSRKVKLPGADIFYDPDNASQDSGNAEGIRSAADKCLRIRRPPPASLTGEAAIKAGKIFNGDDMARAELAHQMFFRPWAIRPNLHETNYAFVDTCLQEAAGLFRTDLVKVSEDIKKGDFGGKEFMPLTADDNGGIYNNPYFLTIPTSIQY